MTQHAIAISRYSKTALALLAFVAAPLAAQDSNVRDRTPDMRDIASTPIQDLNLTRDEIPEALADAVIAPYASEKMIDCKAIETEIARFDAVLGPDLDIETEDRDDMTVGNAAKSAVASFIPFRGVIRQLTGAAAHQRRFEQAIYAGAVRRGFLKGLGEQRGCAYPARPAFARVNVTKRDRVERMPVIPLEPEIGIDGTVFVSTPVVQETDD